MAREVSVIQRNPSFRSNARPSRKRQPRPSARERKQYIEAIRAHFEKRQRRLDVVATTRTAHGQVVDWVPIESQVRNGRIAAPPSENRALKISGRRRAQLAQPILGAADARLGPTGTVPIARPRLMQLPAVGLSEFLSKHGHSVITATLGNGIDIELPADGASPHLYAASAQFDIAFGCEGTFSLNPAWVEWSNEFSLMQTSVSNNESGVKQTAEVGWQVYKQMYGDWIPHLFIFYTTNGYTQQGDNKGGYNTDVAGWVQRDNVIFPRSTFSALSTPGSAQFSINIKVQLFQSNWWIRVQGRWMGYYPESLFQGGGSTFSSLGDHANRISFYGEITDQPGDNRASRTDMGSGRFADQRWPWAAFQKNLKRQSTRQGALVDYNGAAWATDATKYTVEDHFRSGTDWGSYMWLGGPGAG
jgi:hypothetical protein